MFPWVKHTYFLNSNQKILLSLSYNLQKKNLLQRQAEESFSLKYLRWYAYYAMFPQATIQDLYFFAGSIHKVFPPVRHIYCPHLAQKIMCSPLGYPCKICWLYISREFLQFQMMLHQLDGQYYCPNGHLLQR